LNTLARYLEALADPMAHAPTLRAEVSFVLRALDADAFARVVCVPVRGESPDAIVRLLASIPNDETGPVLTVLVLSGQAGDAPSIGKNNAGLEAWMAESLERLGPQQELRRYYRAHAGAVLLVDRHGPGRRFGAGEANASARKVAADLALRVWFEGLISSKWLSFVDPDMILPHDFFEQQRQASQDTVALVHDSRVLGDDSLTSLASSWTLRFEAYAQAGGWPTRDTGDVRALLSELETLGRVTHSEGEALLKAPSPADAAYTRTARSPDAAAPKRSAFPR
jgi:hypothetical protein